MGLRHIGDALHWSVILLSVYRFFVALRGDFAHTHTNANTISNANAIKYARTNRNAIAHKYGRSYQHPNANRCATDRNAHTHTHRDPNNHADKYGRCSSYQHADCWPVRGDQPGQ